MVFFTNVCVFKNFMPSPGGVAIGMKARNYRLNVHVFNQENGYLWQNYQSMKYVLSAGTSS